ncbi:hypothetical protein L195_g041409, partial [Trifolium pratense]
MPLGCCKDIDSMLAKFWWESNDERRKIHWMSWKKLSKAKIDGGMGFRGMEDFNKALLGKHCWRLVTGEWSLLEKIFRSRYYPNGNFRTAKKGYQPSYAWRSILSALDLVDKGGLWKIGNGRKVRIWKESWMPDLKIIEFKGDNCPLSEDARVAELIDVDTKQWKRGLIFSCFDRHVAKQIINIPLSFRLSHDLLIWNWEKDGDYSVRSAYHLLCDEKARFQPGPSCPQRRKLWKEIWRAPGGGILTTLVHEDPLGIQLFCTLLWKFWAGRNAVIFNGWQMDPTRLALDAMNFVHEFNEANPSRNRRVLVSQAISDPPRSTSLNSMFVDAGCCNSGHTVWGLVLRNMNGETTFSACKREDITAEPLLAEALGVRWALQVATDQ